MDCAWNLRWPSSAAREHASHLPRESPDSADFAGSGFPDRRRQQCHSRQPGRRNKFDRGTGFVGRAHIRYAGVVRAGDSQFRGPAETENTDFFPSMSTPELGIAQFEFSHGAKQVMVKPRSHAQRAFTEADVARMNDANGLVRFKGKTEHVD